MSELDVIAIGRSGLDLYAEQIGIPFEDVRSFAAYVGGTPANIVVGLQRLRVRTALVTAVSDDPVGDFIVRFLEKEQVDTRFIRRKPGVKSGVVLLGIHPPDHFPRVHYRENTADQHLSVADVEAAPLGACRMLVVVGTSLTHNPGRAATLRAAEVARSAGASVVVDLDYRSDLWLGGEQYALAMRELLPLAHLAIGTTEEFEAAIPEMDAREAAVRMMQIGVELVVEKCGQEGCNVYTPDGEVMHVPGFAVEVQNTLGAGDAFAAGFLHGRLHGWDLRRSARLGNACGAIVVTRHACAASCPTMEEVERFIEDQGGYG